MLKKIEAIIREDKVNDVMDGLSAIGIVGSVCLKSGGTAGREAFNWSGGPEPIRSISCPKFRSTLF